MSGRFASGDPIRVDRVAAEFGVSAVPVREALRVLEAEGRVRYAARRGYTVTRLSHREVEEIFRLCGLLETEALRQGVPATDAEAVARMGDLLAELESLSGGDATWRMVAVRRDFHFVPIERSGLPLFQRELRRLWDHTDHHAGLYFFTDEVAARKMRLEHEAIVRACAARDAERVVRLMAEHRAHALAGLAQLQKERA